MNRAALTGHSVLVVEDEPLIALDIAESLQGAGASVVIAHTLSQAVQLVELRHISAAVVDFLLDDGDTGRLFKMLSNRAIPFVLYSGYDRLQEAWQGVVQVSKPARPGELVSAVARVCARDCGQSERASSPPSSDGPLSDSDPRHRARAAPDCPG